MENNKTKVSLVAGEPGAGKSYTLIQQAYKALVDGKSVYIMTPTHSAKANLIDEIESQMCNDVIIDQNLEKLKAKIHVLYGYKAETEIFIDEVGMIAVPTLFSLLYQTERIDGVHIHMFGDIKQLPAVHGNSVIEQLLRNNLKKSLWKFVNDKCYDDFEFNQLQAPELWHLDKPINTTILTTNYRLKKLGYTSYNNDFFTDVIEKVISIPTDDEDEHNKNFNSATLYREYLINSNNKHSLILSATHKRGEEINKVFDGYYFNPKAPTDKTEYIANAPFVMYKDKTYLNPINRNFKTIKASFAFMPVLSDTEYLQEEWNNQDSLIEYADYEFTYYTTVHKAQGATVKSVTFYMGNTPIGNRYAEHYSNNMLYTSITRASDEIKLLGDKSLFEKMRDTRPKSAQKKYENYKADEAVVKLFKQLRTIKTPLEFDDIYSLYEDIFSTIELSRKMEIELENYQVKSYIYSKDQLVRRFKDYVDVKFGKFMIDYKARVYDKYIEQVNANKGKSTKGHGKVQLWLDSLTDVEYQTLLDNLSNMKPAEFQDKYTRRKQDIKRVMNK